MAQITMRAKVDGEGGQAAAKIVEDVARTLGGMLRDAGHVLDCKVGVLCDACGKAVLRPGQGDLCQGCARDELLERQEAQFFDPRELSAFPPMEQHEYLVHLDG